MGKHKEGIDYYPIEADHIYNKKVRLLINEFDSDGYWIWNCLLAKIYKEKGYYLDVENQDELELFAIDVCKKKVSLVKEVINGCIRRGLFDKDVFDMFEILTSDRIQFNYLHATTDRRKKGTVIALIDEILLIDEEENWKNVSIHGIKDMIPGKNAKIPGKISQKKRKEKIEEESKGEENAGACAKKNFKELTEEEFYSELKTYLPDFSKEILRGFYNYWSEKSASGKMKFQLEKTWETKKRLLKWKENQEKFNSKNQINGTATYKQNTGKPVPETVGEGGFGNL